MYYGGLADSGQLAHIIYNIRPDEIHNLGAQSHVRLSLDMPEYTGDITGLGPRGFLKTSAGGIKTKYYQASSSGMFGAAKPPQNEGHRLLPPEPLCRGKSIRVLDRGKTIGKDTTFEFLC